MAEIGSQRKGFVWQVEVSDDRVVDQLDAGGVDLDVVGGPAATELIAAGRQLTDQIGEAPVVWVASGLGAQDGDRVVGGLVPVAEELGGVRVEEDESGVVGWPDGVECG